MHLVVVGGSDAGISTGLRARELDPSVEVTVLVADAFPNFSICGPPYHLSGDVPDWHQLAHRSLQDLEATGMRLLLDHTAHSIDPATRQITPIPGLDLPGVHLLHSMADVFAVQQAIQARQPRRVVIVGAGYIGLEMAEAFTTDLVLVVVGVRPDSALAAAAGAELGARGAIAVDRQMRTSLPGVLAAEDCVHTHHRLLTEPAYLPLGTTAHKQGRVAGENAVGGQASFAGSLGTQVVKVFELAVARTGLRDAEAAAAGFDPVTVGSVEFDHKAYYPGAHRLQLRITGDRTTGRLLGAQLVGHHHAQVAKRIDIPATALFHAMTVQGLSDLDLSYTPPFGSPWDAVQMAAQTWAREVRGGQPTQAASHEARP